MRTAKIQDALSGSDSAQLAEFAKTHGASFQTPETAPETRGADYGSITKESTEAAYRRQQLDGFKAKIKRIFNLAALALDQVAIYENMKNATHKREQAQQTAAGHQLTVETQLTELNSLLKALKLSATEQAEIRNAVDAAAAVSAGKKTPRRLDTLKARIFGYNA